MRTGAYIFLVCGIAAGYAYSVNAAEACPAGTLQILSTTRDAATAAGIPLSATCWNPDDKITGLEAGEAKQFLQQHATKSANVSCLNAEFAQRLAKLMKEVPGGVPTITSGYRGQAEQEKARASGASQVGWCSGYHNYGLAADFNSTDKATLLWMRQNALRFGLTRIPTLSIETGCSIIPGSSFCDPAHIQIASLLPSRDQCGICSSEGGNGILPDVPTPYSPNDDYQGKTMPPMSTPLAQNPITPAKTTTTNTTQTASSATPIYYNPSQSTILTNILSATDSAQTDSEQQSTDSHDLVQDILRSESPSQSRVNLTNESADVGVQPIPSDTLATLRNPARQQTDSQPQQTFTSGDLGGSNSSAGPFSGVQKFLSDVSGTLTNILRSLGSFLHL